MRQEDMTPIDEGCGDQVTDLNMLRHHRVDYTPQVDAYDPIPKKHRGFVSVAIILVLFAPVVSIAFTGSA